MRNVKSHLWLYPRKSQTTTFSASCLCIPTFSHTLSTESPFRLYWNLFYIVHLLSFNECSVICIDHFFFPIWATGHAIRSNCALCDCNHFYRCFGVSEDENAVKAHDSVSPNRPKLWRTFEPSLPKHQLWQRAAHEESPSSSTARKSRPPSSRSGRRWTASSTSRTEWLSALTSISPTPIQFAMRNE